jgi:L-threonylcarbamoyladenylate synthase
MTALVLSASCTSPEEIGGWLRRGATVVVPTETVYGLAIAPDNPQALERVYELKGRPPELHLPIVIGEIEQLKLLGVDYNGAAQQLAARFWPGPLTIVMGFAAGRRPPWLVGRDEVAIRLPAYDLLRAAAVAAGPLMVTSANAHGTGPKRTVQEALASLSGEPDVAVDAGQVSSIASTIVNVRYAPAIVERRGAVTPEDLDDFIRRGVVAPEDQWRN